MSDLELLLSGTPHFQTRINELRDSVFKLGPLDLKSRSLVALAVAIAVQHPQTNEILLWAKQQGIGNEEIGHVTAIATILSVTQFGGANGGEDQALPQTEAATCC